MRLYHYSLAMILVFALAFLGAGCTPPQISSQDAEIDIEIVDHQEKISLSVPAGSTVRDILDEADLTLEGKDRVEPSSSTVLERDSTIQITRVREEYETEEEVIPYQVLRQPSESLPEGEEQLLQAGKNGLREVTYVRVFENGEEVSYDRVNAVVVEEPEDEIVLIGVQSSVSPLPIPGRLVYLSDGNAWMMEESTSNRSLVAATGDLDGRVFSLSDDGNWLLFTRQEEDEDVINSLWAADISDEGDDLVDLEVENVIHFGDWAPGSADEIAYSTVESRVSAPGWQANNDLILAASAASAWDERQVVVETNFGGVYGWWGTNYAYTPDGEAFVFTSPDRVGVVEKGSGERRTLLDFDPYKTKGDWAWMPGIGVGADGNLLYTVEHVPLEEGGPAEESPLFNLVGLFLSGGTPMTLVEEVGMFAYPKVSPPMGSGVSESDTLVAYLQAVFPRQSATSRYRVTVMDRDGSNKKVIFPSQEDPGLEPKRGWGMWAPALREGEDHSLMAVLYGGNIWVVDPQTGEKWPATGDGRVQRLDWK